MEERICSRADCEGTEFYKGKAECKLCSRKREEERYESKKRLYREWIEKGECVDINTSPCWGSLVSSSGVCISNFRKWGRETDEEYAKRLGRAEPICELHLREREARGGKYSEKQLRNISSINNYKLRKGCSYCSSHPQKALALELRGEGKKISSMKLYSWARIEKELEKKTIICLECLKKKKENVNINKTTQ